MHRPERPHPSKPATEIIPPGADQFGFRLSDAAQWVLFVGAAMVVLMSVRLIVDGQRLFDKALKQQQTQADSMETVSAFENAARAWVPGSPWPRRALWHLCIMARSATMRGDVSQALFIWEVVRRSVLATRHVFQPNEAYLKTAEEQIVRLRSRSIDRESLTAEPGVTVQRPADPNSLFSLLLAAGLVLWSMAALGLCVSNRKEKKSLRSVLWIAASVGLAVWLLMSRFA